MGAALTDHQQPFKAEPIPEMPRTSVKVDSEGQLQSKVEKIERD